MDACHPLRQAVGDHPREPLEMAREVWRVIEAQFLGNRETFILQLDERFHAIRQGGRSINDYCHMIKGMANEIRSFGKELYVLERGVPPKVRCLYCLMEVHIYRGVTYPNPSPSRLRRRGWSNHHGGLQMGRARPNEGGGPRSMYL
jgi:hypothetical protein